MYNRTDGRGVAASAVVLSPSVRNRLSPAAVVGHHHHVVCGDCGKVEPFAAPTLESAIANASKRLGFSVVAQDVPASSRRAEGHNVLVVRVLLALGLLAVAAPAALAAPSPSVTIGAQPPDLLRDRRLTLFGAVEPVRAKQQVTLEARDCGESNWRLVAQVETDPAGGWSWPYFYPGITASIRARWQGTVSAPVLVRDRVFVELRRLGGSRYAVSVRAKRSFEGRRVLFQRHDPARGWVTTKTVVLTESGAPPGVSYIYASARFTAPAPARALVRAHVPLAQARPCYLGGRSNLLRLR